jgi:hypothetical protein
MKLKDRNDQRAVEIEVLKGILQGVFSNREMFITMNEAAKAKDMGLHEYLVWHSKGVSQKYMSYGELPCE